MIKLTARKALADALAISVTVPSQLLLRVAEFKEAAGPEHCAKVLGYIQMLEKALQSHRVDWPHITGGIQCLIDSMPSYTYGEIPAGTSFRKVTLAVAPLTYVKRKEGVEVLGADDLSPHLAADCVVEPINW